MIAQMRERIAHSECARTLQIDAVAPVAEPTRREHQSLLTITDKERNRAIRIWQW
jgi:hypothetical protein